MNDKPISEANDPDLRNVDAALKRAAARAREIARQSGTKIVVNRGGKTVLIDPDDLPNSGNEASK
jgi:hypothetical protein